jgi:glutaredoxin 3
MMIKIYTSPICMECEKAKKFFKENNLKYEEIDTFDNEEETQIAFKKAGQKRVPIIQINNKYYAGFDKKKIEEELK